MVERSVTTVEGCAVRGCGEEGLWACESALLIWGDCQVSVYVRCARTVALAGMRARVGVYMRVRVCAPMACTSERC